MNRSLIFLGLSLFTWGVGESMFLTFHPLYLEQLGASPLLLGTILGAMGISMAVVQAPAGYLTDRFGHRGLLLSAWFVGLASAWMMALARTLPVFVAGMLLYGLTSWVVTPLNSYVTSASGKWSAGRALTMISATFHAGSIVGPLLGGVIGDRLGLRYSYLIAACIFVLSTGLILFLEPQPLVKMAPGERRRDLFKNSRYFAYLPLAFGIMFVLYLPQPLSPNFLQHERGLSFIRIGQLIAISGIGIVAANLILGQLRPRLGLLAAQVALGVFALAIWQGTGLAWYLAGYFVLGTYRPAHNLIIAQVRELVPPAIIGLAYGIAETVLMGTTIIAPPLAGFLYARDPALVYPVALVFLGGMFVLSLWLLPDLRQQASSEPGLAEPLSRPVSDWL